MLRFFLILLQLTSRIHTLRLDLSHWNISENSYVSSIALISNRAFLTLPKSTCFNSDNNLTIIEVPFNNMKNSELMNFGGNSIMRFHLNLEDFQGSNTNCYLIQDAISVVSDKLKSRLWILDKGNAYCPPKLFTCHLYSKNYEIYSIPFGNNMNRLSCVILLKSADNLLMGFEDSNELLIFSIRENQFSRLHLESDDASDVISTQFLCLSLKNPSTLYLTGSHQRGIYSLDLKFALKGGNSTVKATKIGDKLGNSSGLISDFREGLTYYSTRDYAVIRWDTRRPSGAESVSVLGQSYDVLPYVSQLFAGPQFGVWALVNPGPYRTRNCGDFQSPIKDRVVKLLKYNNF